MGKFQDLSGQKFGKLNVKYKDSLMSKVKKRTYWVCDCDCGTKDKSIQGQHLLSGAVVSCGCHGRSVGKLGLVDITGKKYGRLTVLKRAEMPENVKSKDTYWYCQCDCGNTKVVRGSDMKSGKIQSCGCYNKEILTNRIIDLKGKKIGRLTVLYRDPNDIIGGDGPYWICECECGNQIRTKGSYLRNGETKSCGCIQQEDLTGQKFNKLTVLNVDTNHYSNGRHWICKCDCGNIISVVTTSLKKGLTKSCGCIRATDLTGEIFGQLTVLYRDTTIPVGQPVRWICECECGNIKSIAASALRGGQVSCGCNKGSRGGYNGGANLITITSIVSKKEYKIRQDLTGQKLGRLTVLGFDKRTKSGTILKNKWLCQCECGKKISKYQDNLKCGATISCGCYKREQIHERDFIDMTGMVFGYWTVVKHDENNVDNKGKTPFWVCKCQCGNVKSIFGATLRNGMSTSCGCSNEYRLESWTNEILSTYEFIHEGQVKFDELLGTGGKQLSYDFGVYVDDVLVCLIECQGEQHYHPVDYFGGEDRFEMQKEHDRLKREYAEFLEVPLLEIPYTLTKYQDVENLILSTLNKSAL